MLHSLFAIFIFLLFCSCKSVDFSAGNRRKTNSKECPKGQVKTSSGCSAPSSDGQPLPEGGYSPLGPLIGGSLDLRTLPEGDYDCRQHLKFLSTQKSSFSQENGGSQRYQDVMENAPIFNGQPYRHFARFPETGLDLVTSTHETIHFYGGLYGQRSSQNPRFGFRFIYFGAGKGAPLARSTATKSQTMDLVSPFVKSLTSVSDSANSPYNIANTTYVIYLQQQSQSSYWEQRLVGHIFEEYNCYLHDGRVGIELAEANFSRYIDQPKFMSLMYFVTAGTKAMADNDANYFSQNAEPNQQNDYHQLKAVYACMAEDAMELHGRAKKQSRLDSRAGDLILAELRTGSGSQHLRNHLKSWLGPKWTQRVFGF